MITMDCNCGKRHSAPLNQYIIESGAVNKLPDLLKDYSKVYMVCDPDTYLALGKNVEEVLTAAGKFSHKVVLRQNPLPDYETIGDIMVHLHNPNADADLFKFSPRPDFILAVGSGTINDSCRLVSYRTGIPYGVAGTAPSMDGYASAGSPILCDNTKKTIKATTPRYIVADLDVMKNAPFDMLLAGIGDMFGKYTGILDWELARDYNNDYFCQNIANDVMDATNLCLENGYNLKDRDAKCIGNIMQGFMVTGLGMAYTGNSRPASGSEHIIAHAWELADVENGEKPELHGLEVCQATRIVAIMYKRLYNETGDAKLKSLIEKYLPYFEKVEEFCQKMSVPNVTLDRQKILNGIKRGLTLRDRYTILFYLRDNGLFDDYADYATEEFLKNIGK